MLLWIILFSIVGSIGAVAGAALFLLFPEGIRKTLVPCLVSYATGTLLGAAFLAMIPAGLEQAPAQGIMVTVLAGMVLFLYSRNSYSGTTAMRIHAKCMVVPAHSF